MNINGGVYREYNNSNKASGQVNPNASSAVINKNSDVKAIMNLQANDMFMGKITNITNKDVTILLDGLNSITAKMGEALTLNIGDELLFQVKDNDGKQLTIRPVMTGYDAGMLTTIDKALDNNGFMLNEKNVNIAKELMLAGESLDRETMLNVMKNTVKFPEASIETIVGLNKLNLPITEGNINQYEQYFKYNHQLNNNIDSFSEAVADVLLNNTMSDDKALSSSDAIINIISDNTENLSLVNQKFVDGLNELIDSEKNEVVNGKNALDVDDTNESSKLMLDEDIHETLEVDKNKLYNIANKLVESGVDPKVVSYMINKSASSTNLLNDINATLNQLSSSLDSGSISEFIGSVEYKALLMDTIKKLWSVKPENMKDAQEIKSLYEKIESQTNKLMDTFTSDGSNKNLSQQGRNMNESMQFINDLNGMYSYAQIPVKFHENQTNSELFVYANKNKVMKKDGEVSVLLHLDMDNLGPTDVHVSLHGKNVHARFYLDDDRSVEIVGANMSELVGKLHERGFELTDEVVKKTKPQSNMVVDEIIDSNDGEDKEKSIKRYTFDMRM